MPFGCGGSSSRIFVGVVPDEQVNVWTGGVHVDHAEFFRLPGIIPIVLGGIPGIFVLILVDLYHNEMSGALNEKIRDQLGIPNDLFMNVVKPV